MARLVCVIMTTQLTAMRVRLLKYHGIAAIGSRVALTYRASLLMRLVAVALQVYLLSVVWRAVYGARDSVSGVALDTMITYATLASVQTWLVTASSSSLLPQRIREGRIATDLCGPVGIFEQIILLQVGQAAVAAPPAVLVLLVASAAERLSAPASAPAVILYLISVVLGFAINLLIVSLLGMTAFWTVEVSGLMVIYQGISQFLAGALVPLWFMPGWLRATTEVLPFQALVHTPVSLYLGRLTGWGAVHAVAVQMCWVLIFLALGNLAWKRCIHRVVMYGG